jgi:hypothetical protein
MIVHAALSLIETDVRFFHALRDASYLIAGEPRNTLDDPFTRNEDIHTGTRCMRLCTAPTLWSQSSAGVREPNKIIQHTTHDLDVRLLGAGSISRLSGETA